MNNDCLKDFLNNITPVLNSGKIKGTRESLQPGGWRTGEKQAERSQDSRISNSGSTEDIRQASVSKKSTFEEGSV